MDPSQIPIPSDFFKLDKLSAGQVSHCNVGAFLSWSVGHLGHNLLILFRRILTSVGHPTIDFIDFFSEMVDPSGIEPLTSCMPCRRSPS